MAGEIYKVQKQEAPIDWVVEVPGSKSMTNRALLMAALFLLPLAVIAPFRGPLLSRTETPDETEQPPPFTSGVLDGGTVLKVTWFSGRDR